MGNERTGMNKWMEKYMCGSPLHIIASFKVPYRWTFVPALGIHGWKAMKVKLRRSRVLDLSTVEYFDLQVLFSIFHLHLNVRTWIRRAQRFGLKESDCIYGTTNVRFPGRLQKSPLNSLLWGSLRLAPINFLSLISCMCMLVAGMWLV